MDPTERRDRAQILAYPFRIFFFSVAVWATIAAPLWVSAFRGFIAPNFVLAPTSWHAHEMLYGFFLPAVAGFLLTAVTVWTSTVRTHGLPLGLMWLVWLLGRIAMLFGGDWPFEVVAAINLAFPIWILADAAKRILPQRQGRQYPLLIMLLLIVLLHAGFLWSDGATHFVNGTLILAMGVMLVVGGRITPAFSRNWLLRVKGAEGAARVESKPALEKMTIASVFILLLTTLAQDIPAVASSAAYYPVLAVVALLTAGISATRLALWRGWLTREEPLLWILHLSLAWIPLSLILFALHALGVGPSFAWVHAMGMGAMGGLILGVMSRVVLGHTGRPLVLPRGIVTAYLLIHAGAVIRVLLEIPALGDIYRPGLDVSAMLWSVAFLIFLWQYGAMLFQPRVDGKVG